VVANSRQIIDYTKISPDTARIIAKKIQKEIGMDEVQVRSIKGQILLEGEVYSQQAKQKAVRIASLYADKVIDTLDVRQASTPPLRADTVEVTAHFVEVAKNFSRNFNFRWSPVPKVGTSLSYNVNPVTGSDAFSGAVTAMADDILPKLNYFKTLGVARVLENPTVSVKSGEKATIESGTKVGFPIVQPNGAVAIQFQNVGAVLEIEPKTLGTDIDMKLSIKISNLGSPEVNGGVAIEESSVVTSQIVRSGESIVVGGLIRHSNRQALDRPPQTGGMQSTLPTGANASSPDPFGGSLFTLFKSNDVSKQRSQFLVFITPRILKFSKDANRALKEQFNLFEVYPQVPQSTDAEEAR
jgi:Flp pilus assembly secretin CpaC